MNNDKTINAAENTQDPTSSDKPKVLVVDLDEVRDALGGAAPSTGGGSGGSGGSTDYDTTGCPW